MRNRCESLNDLYAVIGQCRVLKALLEDRVKSNSQAYDECKDAERVIRNAEAAYKYVSDNLP